jgi:hypothetical protein
MILAITLLIIGIVAVVAIFRARTKGKDSNGPMTNN